MHFLDTFAGFRARSVAGHAFTVQRLLFGRARSYASPVVFQKVFRASSHAGCAIRVLAVRIRLPRIRRRIVPGRNDRRNPRLVVPRVVKLWSFQLLTRFRIREIGIGKQERFIDDKDIVVKRAVSPNINVL